MRAAYAVCADSLFTYCLSVLCDHDDAEDAAVATLRLALAHHAVLADERHLRPWLYALARHVCLRQLDETRRRHTAGAAARTARRSGRPRRGGRAAGRDRNGAAPAPAALLPAEAARRRAEVASLSWPEASGLAPRQREGLELAVRHGLAPAEVGAVLDLPAAEARELLAGAAHEVERTRAALAAVESGVCPGLARIADSRTGLVGDDLRIELVRHVESCGACLAAADRTAPGGAAGELPVIAAPEAARGAGTPLPARARLTRGSGDTDAGPPAPPFDRRGFPTQRPPRTGTPLWRRALVISATALLVTAPLVVLWAVNRSYQVADDPPDVSISSVRVGPAPSGAPESAGPGSAPASADGARPSAPAGSSGDPPDGGGDRRARGGPGSAPPASAGHTAAPGHPGAAAPRLNVDESGGRAIVLRAAGGTVHWRAVPASPWLHASPAHGTLRDGDVRRVVLRVDRSAAPAGRWTATVSFPPSREVAVVRGRTPGRPAEPEPTRTPTTGPSPSGTPPAADD